MFFVVQYYLQLSMIEQAPAGVETTCNGFNNVCVDIKLKN